MEYSKLIRELRLKNNMNMEQLAELVGVVKSQVLNWESGKRKPGITSLHKLTELFGVDFVDMDTNRVYEPIAEYKSINKSEEKKSVPFYDTSTFPTTSLKVFIKSFNVQGILFNLQLDSYDFKVFSIESRLILK